MQKKKKKVTQSKRQICEYKNCTKMQCTVFDRILGQKKNGEIQIKSVLSLTVLF